MKKQIILIFAFVMLCVCSGKACDACGCSVTSGGIGLLPQMPYNFAGMRWQHSVFRSVDGYGKGDKTTDRFDQLEIWGRYYFSSRFQLATVIPYKFNSRTGNNTLPFELSGLGDISFTGLYSLVKTLPNDKNPGHQFDIGGGIKFPTGKYDPIQGDKLPDNMNLGTGSFDFMFQALYTMNFGNAGFTTNAIYRLSTENSYGYKFGNRFSGSIYGFWQKKFKNASLVPYGGFFVESIAKDQLYGSHPHGTGGHGFLGTLGLDFYIDKVAVGASYQHAFSQYYADGEMVLQPRFAVSVAYLF